MMDNTPSKGAGAVAKGSALFMALVQIFSGSLALSRSWSRVGRPARLAGPSLHLICPYETGARDTCFYERGKNEYALWREKVKKIRLYVNHPIAAPCVRDSYNPQSFFPVTATS